MMHFRRISPVLALLFTPQPRPALHLQRYINNNHSHVAFTTFSNDKMVDIKAPVAEDKYAWNDIWSKGLKQGERWDIGRPEPELSYELSLGEQGSLAPLFQAQKTRRPRALVPGCGRGYSVRELAKYGFKTMGADISASAVAIAQAECSHENAEFACVDFFKDDIGTFDLVYDATFLCAIPPVMWLAWAERMNAMIAPGGYLAMYVYPVSPDKNAPELAVDGSDNEPGPPHRVSLKLIRSLLEPHNFEEVALRLTPDERIARANARQLPDGQSPLEYFMVWRKPAAKSS